MSKNLLQEFKNVSHASLLGILLLISPAAFATHPDIARLATQLNLASGQLAYELRGSGAYSTIRQRSEYLSREAADLVDAVRRNRSNSQVRAQFQDVSQRFASLEQAFLRLHRKDFNPYMFNELDRISGIYSSLSAEFRYTSGYGYGYDYGYGQPNGYNPPLIIYQQVPVPGYGVSRGFVNPGRPRLDHKQDQGRDRREYGSRQVQKLPNFDHRSPVLDRQQRLDRRPQVDRGRRSGSSETRRRNHYETD